MDKLKNQPCPICRKNTLTLTEEEVDVPHFGKTYLFSMICEDCKYHQSDVESAEQKEPCRLTIMIDSEKDMNIKIVKSSNASIKIPELRVSVESGPASDGYISNVEGVLDRFKKIIEGERDEAEEDDIKKKAKNLLKKIWKVKLGEIPIKVIIEDKSGNSAIISDKVKVEKLK